jgi:hypothetical protein
MMDESSNAGTLEGQWETIIPSLKLQADPSLAGLSVADLDRIVTEYAGRSDGQKAPVVLGDLSQGSREPIARIDQIRRKGDSVEGKFTGVDPRIDYLRGRGALSRKATRLELTPSGVSLDSVGLIQPTSGAGSIIHNDRTPSLDELMKQHTGVRETVFGESKMRQGNVQKGYVELPFVSSEMREAAAQNAVSELEKRGRWSGLHDRYGIRALFAEIAGTPAFQSLLQFMQRLGDDDPSGAMLSEFARYHARQKGVTFGEALGALTPETSPHPSEQVHSPHVDSQGGAWGAGVSAEVRKEERRVSDLAVKNRALPAEIVDLAWKWAEAHGWPFKTSLQKVAAEHPEIMNAFQLANLRAASGSGRPPARAWASDPATNMGYAVAAQKNISFCEALSEVAAEYWPIVVL